MNAYRYRGARALVLLHEQHLRDFLATWKTAKESAVKLPPADDPDYASLDALLNHVMRCAAGYMFWICKQLELPDPEFLRPPEADAIASEADAYMEHVLERWRQPLADVAEERFHEPSFAAPWDATYCIDAMLEHAVMHPIRHRFQLMELMETG